MNLPVLGPRRLAAAAVFAVAPALAAAASPVVDDANLGRQFVAGLGGLVDAAAGKTGGTLRAEDAQGQLASAADRRVALPDAATPCALGPDDSLYDAVMPAIVVVGSIYKCDACNDWHLGGLATGWLASEKGLVVTNHHVFGREKGHHFGVMTADGRVFGVDKIVAADEAGDAVVVRIAAGDRRLPWLPLGQPPECGTEVTVISHPAGRFYCLTEGVVSRYHRARQPVEGERGEKGDDEARRPPTRDAGPDPVWMSVTADYAVGSSGGPVFNAAGEVVGMVSRTFSSRPAGPQRRGGGGPGEQMVFKDCVSLDTLRGLVDDVAR